MSGIKGKSGRKAKPRSDTKWAQKKAMEAQEALIRLQNYAKDEANLKRDARAWLEANKYVYEAEHGRPHQAMDMRVKAIVATTGDDYALAVLADEEAERKLIEEHNATKQSTDECPQKS